MNNVRAIQKLNERELELAVAGGRGSWHEDYKDSAYIFIGGLPRNLTEGDVITIFSQYGEVLDINLPRDKENGERRGFGFLMYEDQRSTVLAVDNLNGAVILERTIRVDHTKDYKQTKKRGDDGKLREPDEPSLNAAPRPLSPGPGPSRVRAPTPEGDLEDPMLSYLDPTDEDERRREEHKARKAERAKIRAERAERSGHHHSRFHREDRHRHDRVERDHRKDRSEHLSRHDRPVRDRGVHRSRSDSARDGHRPRHDSERNPRVPHSRPREKVSGQEERPRPHRDDRPRSGSQSPRRF